MKNKQIKLLVERYPVLKAIENEVFNAYQILENCYAHGGKLLVAGNGGSAADAEHIVGELMKGFKLPRKPDADFAEKLVAENQEFGSVLAGNLQGALPAIALDGHPALSTAYMNDCEPLLCFAQQVNGYGKTGDVFLGMEDNQAKCEGAGRSNVCVSYHALSEDWSEIADRTINMLEKIIENEAVHAMLAVLTDKQRDLIHQQFVLGKTHQEIADDMGISRGSVTRAVNQALERIRRKFDFEAHYELAAGGLA